MTHLRKMMLDELQLRNYAQNTIRHYVRTVEDFARRFRCSPDRLGPRHVREYQAELFRKGKSPGTVTQRLAALRFFYTKTLRRTWSLADTPYPKKIRSLPTISEPGRSRTTSPCGAYSWRTHLAHDPLGRWCPELGLIFSVIVSGFREKSSWPGHRTQFQTQLESGRPGDVPLRNLLG